MLLTKAKFYSSLSPSIQGLLYISKEKGICYSNSRPEVVFLDIRAARKKVLVNLKSQLFIRIFHFNLKKVVKKNENNGAAGD